MAGAGLISIGGDAKTRPANPITRKVAGRGLSTASTLFFIWLGMRLTEVQLGVTSGFHLRLGISILVALLCLLTGLDLQESARSRNAVPFSRTRRGLLGLGPALVGVFAAAVVLSGEWSWFYGLGAALGVMGFAASLIWALRLDRQALSSESAD